jgi:hypothetical protein
MTYDRRLAVGLVLLGLAACSSIGPATVGRDRVNYGDALANATNRETLLNIVKLRYADTPGLVSVSQLVAGYTLEGRVDLRTDLFTDSFSFSDDVHVGVGGTFSDRPTVTYAPVRGDDFAHMMLTPIAPSELLAMLAAGVPSDLALGLGVQSINELRNLAGDPARDARFDPAFAEVVALLGELRQDHVLGFRFEVQTSGDRTVYLLLAEAEGEALDPRARRLLDLLGLDPDQRRFPIRFGFGDGQPTEIRIYTRSLIEILGNLAAQIEVPQPDVSAGRTYPTRMMRGELGSLPAVVIKSRWLRPFGAFVAVEYRGTWYWIDDRDYASKRVFTALMLLVNLVERPGEVQLPVITIPTG